MHVMWLFLRVKLLLCHFAAACAPAGGPGWLHGLHGRPRLHVRTPLTTPLFTVLQETITRLLQGHRLC